MEGVVLNKLTSELLKILTGLQIAQILQSTYKKENTKLDLINLGLSRDQKS